MPGADAKNVVFFASQADAVAAGLRACKRCRPEQFYAGSGPERDLFAAAVRALDADVGAFPDVGALARQAGVGRSRLHALAVRYAGTTPGEVLHAHRIRAAERLLRAGRLGATEVAFAVGYGSVSAFYARFEAATGVEPGAFARSEGA